MQHSPAMLTVVSSWIASTRVRKLSLEAQGAYWRLLCHAWADGGISDPAASPRGFAELGRLLAVSARKAKAIWQEIAHFWERTESGLLQNETQEQVRATRLRQVEARADLPVGGGKCSRCGKRVGDGLRRCASCADSDARRSCAGPAQVPAQDTAQMVAQPAQDPAQTPAPQAAQSRARASGSGEGEQEVPPPTPSCGGGGPTQNLRQNPAQRRARDGVNVQAPPLEMPEPPPIDPAIPVLADSLERAGYRRGQPLFLIARRAAKLHEEGLTLEHLRALDQLAIERSSDPDPAKLLAFWLDQGKWREVLDERGMKVKEATQRARGAAAQPKDVLEEIAHGVYGSEPRPIRELREAQA